MDTLSFGLLIVALAVGAVCRYRRVNAALPLIAAGLIAELIVPNLGGELPDPEFILTLVLAPLVFAAALASSAVDLRAVRRSVLLLAVGLVVITTLVVGLVASVTVAAFTLASACALGAILAPTDAVAASSVASKSGLPRRVILVIEGESLANDGTALTILRVAVLAAVAGSVTLLQGTGILLAAVVGGILVGVAGGWAVSWLMRVAREPIVANAILLITPFALYEVSEHIGGSGLLTVVIGGVWIAHATDVRGNYQTRLQAASVWSLITFVLESFAFVLVGAEFLDTYNRVDVTRPWLLAVVAVALTVLIMVVRSVFMAGWFIIGPKVAKGAFADRRSRGKEFIAIGLLGVRGPVSVLAAFSIPETIDSGEPFPGRDLILSLTFGVVIASLLSSVVATPIIKRLHLTDETESESLDQARLATAKAALRRLDELIVEADDSAVSVDESVVEGMRTLASRRVKGLKAKEVHPDSIDEHAITRRDIQQSMLQAERDELERLRSERNTPGEVVRELTRELDLRQQALDRPDHG